MPLIQQLTTDPKIKVLETRIHHMIEISMERVVAHFKDAAKYPLPAAGKSVERAMYDLMALLPDRKRKDFVKKFETNLAAGSAKRKQLYGDLEAIDFKSARSVAEQVKEKPVAANMQLTAADVQRYKNILQQYAVKNTAPKPGTARRAAAAIVSGTSLTFTVVDMTCTRTSEIRKDELSLGAFFIDPLGQTIAVEPFEVGDFKKGDNIPLGAAGKIFESAFGDSTVVEFPQTFIANLFLLEKDLLRNSKVLGAIVKVLAAITAAGMLVTVGFGIAFFASGFNLVAGGIALIAGMISMGGIALIKLLSFLADDFSDPVSDVIVFDVLPNVGEVFNRTAAFELFNGASGIGDSIPGKYTANIKWEVV